MNITDKWYFYVCCKFMFSEYFCISTFVFELLFAHCVFVHRALGKYPSFRLPVKQRGTTSVKQRNQQPPLFQQTQTNEILILSILSINDNWKYPSFVKQAGITPASETAESATATCPTWSSYCHFFNIHLLNAADTIAAAVFSTMLCDFSLITSCECLLLMLILLLLLYIC